MRTILHIDFDSFFASCEQQDHPEFRGKPLGVTATNGRNCIIASSREAKRLGIGTATPVWEARKVYPDIALIGANFNKYWEYSQEFIKICKDFAPDTEVFSIDEVFMDVTPTLHLFGGVYTLVNKIKQRIDRDVGPFITVSVGISHNKLLAKLASGLDKPNGVVEITRENLNNIYRRAELTDICGIGRRIKLRLNVIGIYTLLDLQKTPLARLVAEFGNVEGHFLKAVGLGQDVAPVVAYTNAIETKSVGRNYCLPKNEYNSRRVLQNIAELCEEVSIKLRRLHKQARTIGCYLSGSFSFGHRYTHPYYFSDGQTFFNNLLPFIYQNTTLRKDILHNTDYVRQIGVWAANLRSDETTQLSFFENIPKKQTVTRVLDSINDRFGDHTIRNGFLTYSDKLTTVPNGFMADKYERELLRVKF